MAELFYPLQSRRGTLAMMLLESSPIDARFPRAIRDRCAAAYTLVEGLPFAQTTSLHLPMLTPV